MKLTTKVRLGKWITATASSLLVISVMLLSGYALAADISDNFNDMGVEPSEPVRSTLPVAAMFWLCFCAATASFSLSS